MNTLNILIIEDNEDHLYFIKKALNSKKYNYKIIGDGKKAYNYLLKPDTKPDIILLDNYLPNMNGFEILEKLGDKREAYKFIFMSVSKSEDTYIRALKYGCMGCEKDSKFPEKLLKIIEKNWLSSKINMSYLSKNNKA